jgi:thiamine pyrophosphokinase
LFNSVDKLRQFHGMTVMTRRSNCHNQESTIGMNQVIVRSLAGITLVGGGPVSAPLFRKSVELAPVVVAADGGADRCMRLGMRPQAVIGDMDSISDVARAWVGHRRLHQIAEQDTTDFDKALRSISAPFVLGVGFIGARADHELAAFSGLVQSDVACILLGPRDVVFHVPLRFDIALRRGDRFSLFPLAPVSGESEGLDWPLNGVALAPAGRIGTSNRVSHGKVSVRLSGTGCLGILSRARLSAVVAALTV